MSISNLSGQVQGKSFYISYDLEENGVTHRVTRLAREKLPFHGNNYLYCYHLQMINYSEHKETGRKFHNNKAIDIKIHYALISKIRLESPAEAKQKVEALSTQLTQLNTKLEESASQQAQTAATNAALLQSNQELKEELSRLRQDMVQITSLLK